MLPHHCDADAIFVVVRGNGILTIAEQEEKNSFNLERGDVIKVSAGSTIYLLNKDNNEKFFVYALAKTVNTPGQFQEYFSTGGENPESFYRAFSSDILETAFKVQLPEGVTPFMHITQNEFLGRKHKKLKEEDIAICECKYDGNDPESACGERCLNVLTSTECTPGYCHCGENCRNQRFQKCEYAKTILFRTQGRGWGLLADETIEAGQFIIEYCGEVISSQEAKRRSQAYEAHELKDAYIISLNANYFIDATRKGSMARFINHSCQPNCETRKWTVLGETRVGIFAKEKIYAGTELAYDYNFEWFGGATVRCLCGAANCSIFLGAKSQGFQEYNHVWEDGDARYTVEEVPLYDSAEDEPFPVLSGTSGGNEHPKILNGNEGSSSKLEPNALELQHYSAPPGSIEVKAMAAEVNEQDKLDPTDIQQQFQQANPMISRIRSNSTCRNYNIGSSSTPKKKSQQVPKRKVKPSSRKQVNDGDFAKMFASKEAREEVTKYEGIKKEATSKLNAIYDEIRPAIEEHEGDSQDNVSTSVAEKWIDASCSKYKADFEFYFSVIKNVMCPRPVTTANAVGPSEGGAGPQAAKDEPSEGGAGPQATKAEPCEGGAASTQTTNAEIKLSVGAV